MSPVSLRRQLDQVITELDDCVQLCRDINRTRHMSSTVNLDNLKSALKSAQAEIPDEYNRLRTNVGREFEYGDDTARREMDQHLREVQTKITAKLTDLCYPPRASSGGLQHPGFRILLGHWKGISSALLTTLYDLSRRLSVPPPAPPERSPPSDEVVLTRADFDDLVSHAKNSWEEVIDEGRYVYVNVYNSKLVRKDMPTDAFVKRYPVSRQAPAPAPAPGSAPRPSFSRTQSYERRSGW